MLSKYILFIYNVYVILFAIFNLDSDKYVNIFKKKKVKKKTNNANRVYLFWTLLLLNYRK